MQQKTFLNYWIWLSLVFFSCQNPSHNTTTMILSSIKPVAQWPATTDQEPIDFIYKNKTNCLITYSTNILTLQANNATTTQALENDQELVQLHPQGENYFLLEFDQATYNNVAYTVDNLTTLSKQVLEGIEDPKSIAYHAQKGILYYKHSSVRLHAYHIQEKASTALFPEREVSHLCISDNGQYLALKNSTTITIVNTEQHEIVSDYSIPPGTSYSLIGVTDDGNALVVDHPIAIKNEGQATLPTVLLLQNEGQKPLTEASGGWAKWHQGHLMVLDQKTFKLYDQTILE